MRSDDTPDITVDDAGDDPPPAGDVADLFRTPGQAQAVHARAQAFLRCAHNAAEAEQLLADAKRLAAQAELDLLAALDDAKLLAAKAVGPDGKTYTLTSKLKAYYHLNQERLQTPEVQAWLAASGGQDLVKSTINHMSFGAFCRELVAAGKELHPAVTSAQRRSVQVTKR